jgi:hypothetical protein
MMHFVLLAIIVLVTGLVPLGFYMMYRADEEFQRWMLEELRSDAAKYRPQPNIAPRAKP